MAKTVDGSKDLIFLVQYIIAAIWWWYGSLYDQNGRLNERAMLCIHTQEKKSLVFIMPHSAPLKGTWGKANVEKYNGDIISGLL